MRRAAFRGWPCQHRGWPRQQRVASYVSDRRVPQQESHNSSVSARAASVAQVPGHFGVCGSGSFVVHRLFWNRSCGILGFAGLGLLLSIAYFGIGPAAFWVLRDWVFCRPPPILESVLRHFGVCGIGSFVIHRLFWNRSCGVKRSPLSLSSRHGDMATMCVYCHIFEQQDARPATKSLPTSHKASRLGPHCDGCHSKLMSWRVSCDYSCRQAVLS